jgi:hypothetical protein
VVGCCLVFTTLVHCPASVVYFIFLLVLCPTNFPITKFVFVSIYDYVE